MVTSRLYGRCGNQIFQICAAMGYAKKHNMDLGFSTETIDPDNYPTYFKSLKRINRTQEFFYYKEPVHGYSEIPYRKNILLDGYFQSYLYFDNIPVKEIKLALGLDGAEFNKGVCSIHVRRGDYLKYPTKHPVVTPKYLCRAIEEIFVSTGVKKFLVFGDDHEWNRGFFKNIKAAGESDEQVEKMEFEFSEGKSELEDLKLMSSCEHNIIANSTFSWWGAYLNSNPGKYVVSPHENDWFGPDNRHLDVTSLIPKEWIYIHF